MKYIPIAAMLLLASPAFADMASPFAPLAPDQARSNIGQNVVVEGIAHVRDADGRTNWSGHRIFAPPEMKMFDFCARQRDCGYEAVSSRVWLANTPPPRETGLWWCRGWRRNPRLCWPPGFPAAKRVTVCLIFSPAKYRPPPRHR